ncbi:MAG: DUF5110 domain-containing protein, partial [Bacteroidales bacterium]|nr:DUF5110 domain-containing protein [Bacteroidales bacterium]
DRATLAIVNRNLPVPAFKASKSGKGVTIKTADVTLKYNGKGKFDAKNLSVSFKLNGKPVKWVPGASADGNLMGTFRTLDGCKGFDNINGKGDPYEPGILSRDGWAIVDESERHVLEEDDSAWGEWVSARPEGDRIDWYIFAYGHDYKAALKDFTQVAGRIPLPPKFVFGYWWSRYWQYSDFEFLDLAREIRSHGIPMDVMVIDMDWHDIWTLRRKNAPKDEFGQRIGWTGYTWQKELFPNPEKTLADLHAMNLKTSLNLHPASGIQPYEDCYEPFVKDYLSRTSDYDGPKGYRYHAGDSLLYLRSDPKTKSARLAEEGEKAPVPFRIDQKEWADAYFNSVIHPLEKQGVDFWWLDWQQWKLSEYIPGLSNTFWLNHVFFTDKLRRADETGQRPVIYHRWGGLGSHRYQIGFSGDCFDTWDVLRFLPYFTATSSNVGYGYWGHDIGGHQFASDPYKPEIYTRWLQYGVFTPIFKTHSTKSALIERRVWTYAPEYAAPMREAIRLRYTLSPYIYNAAREAYDSGICICRPLYYDYPEAPEAYKLNEEFLFGDRILATAVCEPVNAETGLAPREIWFPEGDDWYDMATGRIYKGGSTQTLSYTLNENPWWVKAGSIIPMASEDITSLQESSNVLRLFIAPGEGESSLNYYEDDGSSQDYTSRYATTLITKKADATSCKVVVSPRKGSYKGMPSTRRLEFIIEGVFAPTSVRVNGSRVDWKYVGKDLALVVSLPERPAGQELVLECQFPAQDTEILRGKKAFFHRMMAYTPVLKDVFNTNVDPYKLLSRPFLKLAQCASHIDADPAGMLQYLQDIDIEAVKADLEQEAAAVEASHPDRAARVRAALNVILAQVSL